jgi:hypothetical protein
VDPRSAANRLERHRHIAGDERVERHAGFTLPALSFESGHILGVLRATASSIGPPYLTVWHRDPNYRWTLHTNVAPPRSFLRYFDASMHDVRSDEIAIAWRGPNDLAVTLRRARISLALRLGATALTRVLGIASRSAPRRMWQRERERALIGPAAGTLLGAGPIMLSGMTRSGHRYLIQPRRVWRVRAAACVIDGRDAGGITWPGEQQMLGEILLPARALFVAGVVSFERDRLGEV